MVAASGHAVATEGSSLRVTNVTKDFSRDDRATARILALDAVSFSVAAGEFVSIVGPSACGKSTLLRLIAGLDFPSSGELRVGEEVITGANAERGLVFQDPNLFPWLTVRRNIQAGLVALGVLREKRHEVDEFIRLVGLEGFANAYPHHLSGGMAQRVALARALITHPKILLLDEPLGALDAFTRMRMQDEVLRLWQTRLTTMLLVTHDIDEAIYMSDRILIMTPRPGRIERTISVAMNRPRIAAARNSFAFAARSFNCFTSPGMRAYRLGLGEESLVYRLAYNGDVVAFKMGRRHDPAWHIPTRFRNVWHGRDALPRIRGSTSDDHVGAAPPMVDALRRVRWRSMSRRVFCRFCHARPRVPMVFGPFHSSPSVNVLRRTRRKPSTIRGAAPDVAIGRSTHLSGSASLPAPAKWLGPIAPTVYTNSRFLPMPRRGFEFPKGRVYRRNTYSAEVASRAWRSRHQSHICGIRT